MRFIFEAKRFSIVAIRNHYDPCRDEMSQNRMTVRFGRYTYTLGRGFKKLYC